MKIEMDNSPENPPPAGGKTSTHGTLLKQKVLVDFIEAFTRASGLPLKVHGKEECGANCYGKEIPGFCQLIHESEAPRPGEMCGLFNRQLEEMAVDQPHEARCFAGILLTAVPIHHNSERVGYFKTGHVMPQRSVAGDFSAVMRLLSCARLESLTKRAQEAWLAIPVMEPERYRAFVDLLAAFARQISGETKEHDGAPNGADSLILGEAQRYIENHSAKRLNLSEVAVAVGLSPNYFCRRFHDFTGLSFTDYLAGIRIASAARLLGEPGKRIKEIAYEAGFNSISQFNRVFRRTMGISPSAYRHRNSNSLNGVRESTGINRLETENERVLQRKLSQ